MNFEYRFPKPKNIILTLFSLFLILYFVYHSFIGERGILVYLKLRSEYEQLQNELDLTRSERLDIEHKVNLLQPESLDLDILEEQVKSILAFAKEKEEVYYIDKKGEVKDGSNK
jgi:cell division protein FtsB